MDIISIAAKKESIFIVNRKQLNLIEPYVVKNLKEREIIDLTEEDLIGSESQLISIAVWFMFKLMNGQNLSIQVDEET